MKLRIIITAFIIAQGITTLAQDTLKLNDAIALALKNNYSISMAEQNSKITAINNSMGNAGMLPKVDLTGTRSIAINNSHAEYFSGSIRDVKDAKTNVQNAGVQLSWTVFDGLNMFIQRDKLDELQQLSNIQLRGVVENMVAQVSRAYFNIVVQQKLLGIYHEALRISTQTKRICQSPF